MLFLLKFSNVLSVLQNYLALTDLFSDLCSTTSKLVGLNHTAKLRKPDVQISLL